MDTVKRITLYSLSTCGVCKKVRKFLDDSNITYTHIEVDLLDSGEQWLMGKEVTKRNPQGTYPTLVIEDIVIGYDPETLKAKLLS
jgi:glutaredoxin-like protein NrdH